MVNENVYVELRSDTFTQPTKEMVAEMMAAEVGDSIYNEDPTMNKLEREIAELFGKEAALFMPSGTMSNLIAIMAHCDERGCDIIVGDKSHINLWEQGGISQIGGVYVKQIPNLEDGTFDLETLEDMIFDHTDPHCSKTKVICIENTHNSCGGRILPLSFIDQLHNFCAKRQIQLHVDGSRIMNASVALNVHVKELCKHCDSVNFCFSKGLGAPVGSVLIGTKELIEKATKLRKCLGGAMRQTGYLAAACLYSLTQVEKNFKIDHENAKLLAKGIHENTHGLVTVDYEKVETNIVHMKILRKDLNCSVILDRLAQVTQEEINELKQSIVVKAGDTDRRTIRLLTHLNVNREQIEAAIKKIAYVLRELSKNN